MFARQFNVLLVAAHIDGAVVINPSSALLNASTVLFVFADGPTACDAVAKNGTSRVSSWVGQINHNRKVGSFSKRQRAKCVKRHSDDALDLVYSSSATKFNASGSAARSGGGVEYLTHARKGRSTLAHEHKGDVKGGRKLDRQRSLPLLGEIHHHLESRQTSSESGNVYFHEMHKKQTNRVSLSMQ